VLLLIKKKYFDQIVAGTKTYEIRAGSRYRNIKAGDRLSLNGRARFPVVRVQEFSHAEQLPEDVSDCYAADHPGPFFVFHLGPQIT
jgi:ASC-1-like (ASCH) protein